MSFLNKISSMLGKASDWAGNIIKPLKNHVVQGLTKAGNWLDRNHETIGTIASGIGSILQNLPDSKMKEKLQGYGNAFSTVGGALTHNRPSNLARKGVSMLMNGPNIKQDVQQNKQQPQSPAVQPVNAPIQQPSIGQPMTRPAFAAPNRNTPLDFRAIGSKPII